jgi:hypothetical protein
MNPDGKTFNQTIIIKRRRLAVDHSMMNMNSTNSTLVNDTSKTVEEVIV